jgi:hypothetical protein
MHNIKSGDYPKRTIYKMSESKEPDIVKMFNERIQQRYKRESDAYKEEFDKLCAQGYPPGYAIKIIVDTAKNKLIRPYVFNNE